MNNDLEILLIDLDGTLIGPDSIVSERNKQAIKRARDAGLEVIIATGRTVSESRRAIEAIEHQDLLIAAGGALLTDSDGHTLDRFVLSSDQIQRVSQPILDASHKVLILKDRNSVGFDYLAVGEANLDPVTEWWFDHLPTICQHSDSLDQDPHPNDSVRVGAVSADVTLTEVVEELRRKHLDEYEILFWSAVTPHGDEHAGDKKRGPTQLLEIFAKGVSKWTMLERLAKNRGWNVSQIAAIGDGLNDIDLLKNVGLGIAMGNADQHVQDASNYVTAQNTEDGVAEAIDLILAGNLTSRPA